MLWCLLWTLFVLGMYVRRLGIPKSAQFPFQTKEILEFSFMNMNFPVLSFLPPLKVSF